MDKLTFLVALIGEIGVLLSFMIPVILWIKKLSDGAKCQLRSDMLGIYYHHKDEKKVRQYEYEHFIFCYEAYKALRGNSFIEKIYAEVKEWEVLS